VRRAIKHLLRFALVGGVSTWIAFSNTSIRDYSFDAGPAVHALVHGELHAYLSAHVMMGPFATLVQAPFAAIAGESSLAEYQWASLSGLLAVGVLGLYLAELSRRRGGTALAQFVIAALCLVNPLTFGAIQTGHPEELLTAALVVGAVAVASEGHSRRAAILLGLAIASKQWAVIAILPVLMALPARRARAALGAGAVALALVLPGLLVAPGAFSSVQGGAAFTKSLVEPASVWYPVARRDTVRLWSTDRTVQISQAPRLARQLSHPLIVLLGFATPVALALRRRRFGLRGSDAMALLALLGLLRCVLDPVDNLYYHELLLLALLGWDALAAPRSQPLRGLVAAALAIALWTWLTSTADWQAFSYAYLAVTGAAGIAIGMALYRQGDRQDVRTAGTPAVVPA
jgi:hypothetical protein